MLGAMNSVSVLALFQAAKASFSQSFREHYVLGVDDFHTWAFLSSINSIYINRFSSFCMSDSPGYRNENHWQTFIAVVNKPLL